MIIRWNVIKEIKVFNVFNFETIIEKYNRENNTKYSINDVKDFCIKYNKVLLDMWDFKIESYNDFKYPDKIYYNKFFKYDRLINCS